MIGATLGGYRILSELGSGGKGAVYVAEPDGEGSRVALKAIHPHLLAASAMLDRFLREAIASAADAGGPAALVMARVYRLPLPDGDVEAARSALREHEARMDSYTRMIAHYGIGRAARDASELDRARRIPHALRDHAPEEDREVMMTAVPLHRAIAG